MSPEQIRAQALALPSYESPPVIEVACGVHFEPMSGFTLPFFGAFWQTIREQYPTTEEKQPLAPVIEKLGPGDDVGTHILGFNTVPLPRVFLIDDSKNWVMQMQRDRFLHNWRKTDEESVYPRFPTVSQRFFAAWHRFSEFCTREKVGAIQPLQLELTYINHIPLGQGWGRVCEVGNVVPDVCWRPDHSFLPDPESIGWNASFLLPEQQGRLHVQLRRGLRQKDRKTVLLCELTARGMNLGESIEPWFEMAREWIVRGFTDLTSEHVQKVYWRREK